MHFFKKSLTIGIILFGLTGCNGHVNIGATTNPKADKGAVESDDTINLNRLIITYPENWSKRGNKNEIFFDDENNQTVGGISLVGYYGDYNSALPNHSETMKTEDINVSLGKGKLFTLKRSYPAASNNNETWNELHAIIPTDKNNLAFDIWLKGKKETLLNMIKSVHLK